MEELLNELVERLKRAAGQNLRSVVLYGSAAASEYHPKHSDVNVLAVLAELDAAALNRLAPVAGWWRKKGHPGPMVFTEEELVRCSDMFAIELLDIKMGGRLLWGEDIFAKLHVPMQFHRIQVERGVAEGLVKLRQHYLTAAGSRRAVRQLMIASVTTFAALFRHALLALGEPPTRERGQGIDRLAALIAFDATPFHTLLDLRAGKVRAGEIDWRATFAAYVAAIERVASELDRRLAEMPAPARSEADAAPKTTGTGI
jgi:predicted nucleotidyltransferase